MFAPDIIYDEEKNQYYMVYQGGKNGRFAIGVARKEETVRGNSSDSASGGSDWVR